MKLIRYLKNSTFYFPQGCVATIGNFDGVHIGHQVLLEQLKQIGKQFNLPTVVITFEPQPKTFFAKKRGIQPLPRLMRFREKYEALASQNLDYLLCLPFNNTLAEMPAETFISTILIKQLNIKSIIVGDDFRFGAKQSGDFTLLKQLGAQYSFTTASLPTVIYDHHRVSSSRIREILKMGDMELAQKLLGHNYRLSGKVVYGEGRGKTLGFPTANIHLHRELLPLTGIFIVQVLGLDNKVCPGVASIGTRPTFEGKSVWLEVYLFDFDQIIYGKQLQVEFLKKLREEEFFSAVPALVRQIEEDVKMAREYFL